MLPAVPLPPRDRPERAQGIRHKFISFACNPQMGLFAALRVAPDHDLYVAVQGIEEADSRSRENFESRARFRSGTVG